MKKCLLFICLCGLLSSCGSAGSKYYKGLIDKTYKSAGGYYSITFHEDTMQLDERCGLFNIKWLKHDLNYNDDYINTSLKNYDIDRSVKYISVFWTSLHADYVSPGRYDCASYELFGFFKSAKTFVFVDGGSATEYSI